LHYRVGAFSLHIASPHSPRPSHNTHPTPHPPPPLKTTPRSDLGCHIDGWIATQATTIQVNPGGVATPITGRAADAVKAARTAFDVAIRLIKPGKKVGVGVAAAGGVGCNCSRAHSVASTRHLSVGGSTTTRLHPLTF
jgi:hypothetical protein